MNWVTSGEDHIANSPAKSSIRCALKRSRSVSSSGARTFMRAPATAVAKIVSRPLNRRAAAHPECQRGPDRRPVPGARAEPRESYPEYAASGARRTCQLSSRRCARCRCRTYLTGRRGPRTTYRNGSRAYPHCRCSQNLERTPCGSNRKISRSSVRPNASRKTTAPDRMSPHSRTTARPHNRTTLHRDRIGTTAIARANPSV